MTKAAFKILTLFSVLVHAGLGCCAHHDHSPRLTSMDGVPSAVVPHSCGCRHHCQPNADADLATGSGEVPPHQHERCADDCAWLVNSRLRLDGVADAEAGPAVPPPVVVLDHLLAAAPNFVESLANFAPTPPLRAAHQIWRL